MAHAILEQNAVAFAHRPHAFAVGRKAFGVLRMDQATPFALAEFRYVSGLVSEQLTKGAILENAAVVPEIVDVNTGRHRREHGLRDPILSAWMRLHACG